jgi:hypothetical protein
VNLEESRKWLTGVYGGVGDGRLGGEIWLSSPSEVWESGYMVDGRVSRWDRDAFDGV